MAKLVIEFKKRGSSQNSTENGPLIMRRSVLQWLRKSVGIATMTCVIVAPVSCGTPTAFAERESIILQKVREFDEENFRERQDYFATDKDVIDYKEKQLLNILAIGDSVSQGFAAIPNAASPGKMLDDGTIIGDSWPALLANYIQQAQPGKVQSFYNLAITSSTVLNWNYYLDPKNIKYLKYKKESDGKIIRNIRIARNKHLDFVDQMLEHFDFNSENPFTKIQERISKANLIIFTLGGNTMVGFFHHLAREIFNKVWNSRQGYSKELLIDVINRNEQLIPGLIEKAREAMVDIIRRIRQINPDARIVILNYPWSHYILYEQILNNALGIYISLFSVFFEKVNELSRIVGRQMNVSAINLYSNTWSDFSKEYLGPFMDFHPSITGSRWIARQAFLKLCMPSDVMQQYIKDEDSEFIHDYLHIDDDEYIRKDMGEFKREIYLSKEGEQKIRWIAEKASHEMTANEEHFGRWLVRANGLTGIANTILEMISVNNIFKFAENILKRYDPDSANGNAKRISWQALINKFIDYLTKKYAELSKQTVWVRKFEHIKEIVADIEQVVMRVYKNHEYGGSVDMLGVIWDVYKIPEVWSKIEELIQAIKQIPFLFLSAANPFTVNS